MGPLYHCNFSGIFWAVLGSHRRRCELKDWELASPSEVGRRGGLRVDLFIQSEVTDAAVAIFFSGNGLWLAAAAVASLALLLQSYRPRTDAAVLFVSTFAVSLDRLHRENSTKSSPNTVKNSHTQRSACALLLHYSLTERAPCFLLTHLWNLLSAGGLQPVTALLINRTSYFDC